jgi:putative ABC transport system permease protein
VSRSRSGASTSARIFSGPWASRWLAAGPYLPEEQQPGGPNVAILSDGFWHSHFAADRGILAKTLRLDGTSVTVVGVLPADFDFPFAFPEPEVWLPRVFEHPLLKSLQVQMGAGYLDVIGRLAPGVRMAETQAELNTINERYRQQFSSFADANKDTLAVTPLEESLVAGLRASLLVLLAAVAFVLLIACANVANLLLARATAREKEMALRKALGASRMRLVRQMLGESLLHAILGGALGVAIAAAMMPWLRSASPGRLPRVAEARIDPAVLLFCLLLCGLSAVLFGLAPAIGAAKRQLHESLKEGVRGCSGSRGRLRALLVVAEMAAALVLIAGAGLLMESFAHLLRVHLGFSPQGVMTFPLTLPASRYAQPERQTEFYRQLLERVRAVPEVEATGLVSFLPLSGGYRRSYFCFEGQVCRGLGKDPLVAFWQVTPGYFETMRTRLLRGRFFNERDIAGGAPVVMVNETAARHYWPNQDESAGYSEAGGEPRYAPRACGPNPRTPGVARLDSPAREPAVWRASRRAAGFRRRGPGVVDLRAAGLLSPGAPRHPGRPRRRSQVGVSRVLRTTTDFSPFLNDWGSRIGLSRKPGRQGKACPDGVSDGTSRPMVEVTS